MRMTTARVPLAAAAAAVLLALASPSSAAAGADKAGIAKIKEYGIVNSGDAKTYGVGAMTDPRWRDFFSTMSKAGVYPKDLNYRKAYTLQFVNKRIGMGP